MLLRLLHPRGGAAGVSGRWLTPLQHQSGRSISSTSGCFAQGRDGMETGPETANRPQGDTYYATPEYPGGASSGASDAPDQERHPAHTGGPEALPKGPADTSSMNAAAGRAQDDNAGRLNDPAVRHPGEAGETTDSALKTLVGMGDPVGDDASDTSATGAAPASMEGREVGDKGKAVAPGEVEQEGTVTVSEAGGENVKDAPAAAD